MNDLKWKPINPCLDCHENDSNLCYRCDLQHDYFTECSAINGLLNWMLAWEQCDDGNERHRDINRGLILEMKEELNMR